jgi:glycosyltransferase involved in cell wall biosynthesis
MRKLIGLSARVGLAASAEAAESLYGSKWQLDSRWRVLRCGLDFSRFDLPVDYDRLCADFGLTSTHNVFGHIGRLSEAKNHRFLIRLFRQISDSDPDARLLMVGEGPLRDELEGLVSELGLSNRVIWVGLSKEVEKILGLMHVFVFPSLYEGLGLAAVEAQAAGLNVVASDNVPEDVEVLPGTVVRLSLSEPLSVWAAECLKSLGKPRVPRGSAWKCVAASPFGVDACARELLAIYANLKATARRI